MLCLLNVPLDCLQRRNEMADDDRDGHCWVHSPIENEFLLDLQTVKCYPETDSLLASQVDSCSWLMRMRLPILWWGIFLPEARR